MTEDSQAESEGQAPSPEPPELTQGKDGGQPLTGGPGRRRSGSGAGKAELPFGQAKEHLLKESGLCPGWGLKILPPVMESASLGEGQRNGPSCLLAGPESGCLCTLDAEVEGHCQDWETLRELRSCEWVEMSMKISYWSLLLSD